MSLVGHGLAQRLRGPVVGPAVSPSVGLAGVSLLCLLAVLGAQQLVTSGLRGLGLDGYPDEWRLGVLWVDPRWPVHALWVVTALALLVGRHRAAVGSAWAAAALHCWHLVVISATTVELPWPGDVGPYWAATGGIVQASLVVLTVAGAVMMGGPAVAAEARAGLSGRRWWAVAGAGLVGVALASAAGPAAYAVLGNGHLRLADAIRGPVLPLVLAAAVLASGLLRAPHGRAALLLLGMLGAATLAARWSEPMGVLGAGLILLVVGCVLASRRRPVGTSVASALRPRA